MQDSSLRIVFAGTPDFAAEYLQALTDSRHQILAVYTQPDRPAGRGKKLSPSPVKTLALEAQLPVRQPPSLRDAQAQEELAALQPDLMVVVAYGLILPQKVLDIPRFGCINVHASLLPRWRGAAPIQRAIEAGDAEAGVTIMQMDAGLDTGDMLAVARCPIAAEDTAGSLFTRLAQLGKQPLLEVLERLPEGGVKALPQDDEQATYAHKIDKAEAAIDWTQDADLIGRKIRAFNPFPIAYTSLAGQRLKIFSAEVLEQHSDGATPGCILAITEAGASVQCGKGQLLLQELQLPGKRAMTVQEILRGNRELLRPGTQFESAS